MAFGSANSVGGWLKLEQAVKPAPARTTNTANFINLIINLILKLDAAAGQYNVDIVE